MKTLHRLITLALLTTSSAVQAEFVVVAHKDAPVTALAPSQVKAMFNGNLKAFPDTTMIVSVIDQPSKSDLYREFYDAVFRLPPEKIKRRRAAYLFSGQGIMPDTLPDDSAVLEKVANSANAVGYVEASKVDDRVKVLYKFPP
jgi:ABC-type phosphate transport system substrate-binding protein